MQRKKNKQASEGEKESKRAANHTGNCEMCARDVNVDARCVCVEYTYETRLLICIALVLLVNVSLPAF